eukprot:TRINITY_DN50823_c0_g1_i1.p1 TRINITY_DN50823_c0_g1~~TRINITY_DN50823_c0_g1_i1.p1  ORF type:complete len:408 (-),score=53.44 TRINITY_DN50823_c0_g1_i1:169-1392(-)
MDRGLTSCNKACAKRLEQRRHHMHRERIRNIKPLVDTSEPHATRMEHVHNNLKREQRLEERYSEIDRENRILLKKMSDIMSTHASPREEHQGPQSLNRDARKKELLRITRENHSILRRIQQAQPTYNHVDWEGIHRKNTMYLRNAAEYPLVLRQPRKCTSVLMPLGVNVHKDGSLTDRGHVSSSKAQDVELVDDEVKHVFKEGRTFDGVYYLLEMSTDGRILHISAYHGDTKTTLELLLKEKVHRKLYRETGGDYRLIADRLRVDIPGQRLYIDDGTAPEHITTGFERPPLPPGAGALPPPSPGGDAAVVGFVPPSPKMPPPLTQGPSANDRDYLDADEMVVHRSKPVTPGAVNAEIDLSSSGHLQFRLRGLTPPSTSGGGRTSSSFAGGGFSDGRSPRSTARIVDR